MKDMLKNKYYVALLVVFFAIILIYFGMRWYVAVKYTPRDGKCLIGHDTAGGNAFELCP